MGGGDWPASLFPSPLVEHGRRGKQSLAPVLPAFPSLAGFDLLASNAATHCEQVLWIRNTRAACQQLSTLQYQSHIIHFKIMAGQFGPLPPGLPGQGPARSPGGPPGGSPCPRSPARPLEFRTLPWCPAEVSSPPPLWIVGMVTVPQAADALSLPAGNSLQRADGGSRGPLREKGSPL